MNNQNTSANLNIGNVLDSESSEIQSLSIKVYNAMADNKLFAERQQEGGAKVKKSQKVGTTKAGSKKAGSKKAGSKKAGSKKAGSKKAGSKKAGSKRSSKKAGQKGGAKKAGSKKAGSKKAGSKKAGSKKAGSKKAGSKKAGSKRSNKKNMVNNELEQMGGRKRGSNSKRGSKPKRGSKANVNSPVNALSDSISSNINQDGGKNKKGSTGSKKGLVDSTGSKKKGSTKRALPEKLKEFQKLVKHMAASLGHTPHLFKLAKVVRDEIMSANPNASIQDITKKSIKLFDDKKTFYATEYNKIKASAPKAKKTKN
jgi:hypothetical protein